MKLNIHEQNVNGSVPGVEAVIVRDELNGSSLVIQAGSTQLVIKLSDLVSFVHAQKLEDEKAAEKPEQVVGE